MFLITVRHSQWLLKRASSLVVVGALLLSVPFSTFALSVSDVITVADTQSVTRSDFIRATVKGLGIESLIPNRNLPYERIPNGLLPYIDAAHRKNALGIFGKELNLSRVITRGEAMQILISIVEPTGNGASTSAFTDIKTGTPEAKAVGIALANGWVKPQSSTVFGVKSGLKGAEAKQILRLALDLQTTVQPATTVRPKTNSSTVPTVRFDLRNGTKSSSTLPKEQILEAIWKLINNEFLYEKNINPEEAAYKAIEGIVGSLNEPYTTFFRPSRNLNFQSQIDGEVTGIGAQVEMLEGVLTIVSPVRGSPAEAAGLVAGDQIMAVDGQTLTGLGFVDAVDKVRGKKGSIAVLRIRRNGSEFDVSVKRDVIKVPEVIISWQGEVAVVALTQFGKLTEKELRSHMLGIQAKNPKGFILDLRNNPGGLLTAAEKVVGNFVPKGSKVAEIHFRGKVENVMTTEEPTINAKVPVVVLVNEGSASASEIVAGALQDHKRAKIVGVKTFGKGTVQEILQFEDQSSLKMTVAEWLTPNSRKIDKIGVEPDVKVAENGRDEQMLKALDLLR